MARLFNFQRAFARQIVIRIIPQIYLKSVITLLLLTGVGKLAFALGHAELLDRPIPVFGLISNRELLFGVAAVELSIAVLALTGAIDYFTAIASIAILATTFLAYRMTLWAIGFQGYCPCLGNAADVLRLSPHEANLIAEGILLYFIVGTYTLLIRKWFFRTGLKTSVEGYRCTTL